MIQLRMVALQLACTPDGDPVRLSGVLDAVVVHVLQGKQVCRKHALPSILVQSGASILLGLLAHE